MIPWPSDLQRTNNQRRLEVISTQLDQLMKTGMAMVLRGAICECTFKENYEPTNIEWSTTCYDQAGGRAIQYLEQLLKLNSHQRPFPPFVLKSIQRAGGCMKQCPRSMVAAKEIATQKGLNHSSSLENWWISCHVNLFCLFCGTPGNLGFNL